MLRFKITRHLLCNMLTFLVVLTTSSDCYKLNEIYKLFLLFIESQGSYLMPDRQRGRDRQKDRQTERQKDR